MNPLVRRKSTLISRGSIVSLKKCRFRGHFYRIDSVSDVESCAEDIRSLDKKHAKATHPHMSAWICADETTYGFDDNGETGAGKRLLSILQKRNLSGVYIAVTRWYGGSHLGSARFRAIGNAAKDAIAQ